MSSINAWLLFGQSLMQLSWDGGCSWKKFNFPEWFYKTRPHCTKSHQVPLCRGWSRRTVVDSRPAWATLKKPTKPNQIKWDWSSEKRRESYAILVWANALEPRRLHQLLQLQSEPNLFPEHPPPPPSSFFLFFLLLLPNPPLPLSPPFLFFPLIAYTSLSLNPPPCHVTTLSTMYLTFVSAQLKMAWLFPSLCQSFSQQLLRFTACLTFFSL